MHIRIAVLPFVLAVVTGCSQLPTSPLTTNVAQTTRLNTTQRTNVPAPRSQRLAPGETPAARGYNDGYNDGSGGFTSNPTIGISALGLTNPTDIQSYTDSYNRGYTDGQAQRPSPTTSPTISPTTSPSPSPTGSVPPDRQNQLTQQGYQDGFNDAQQGFAANPDSGIAALGLTDPTEKQIYTTAYNNGYRQRPSPSPTTSPGRLPQLRQQGKQDGYNDASAGFAQDPSRGINNLGLTDARERQAYTNAYNNGYQQYVAQQSNSIPGGW